MRGSSIQLIAEVLGRGDTYGFNRLLHDHTSYSQVAVFTTSNQKSYARSDYQSSNVRFITEHQLPGICIQCVKDDIAQLGFPYWRRDHRYVKVCSKHNTLLLRKCPICAKDINVHGYAYGHDLLWKGCKGRYIHQCESKINYDGWQLIISEIFAEIGGSKFTVDLEFVTAHIADEIRRLSDFGWISETQKNAVKHRLDTFKRKAEAGYEYRPDLKYSEYIIYVIAIVYGSFAGLLDSVRAVGGPVRNVSDLMHVKT